MLTSLVQEALRLKELDRAIIKAIAEGQSTHLIDSVDEYLSTKKNIKRVLADIPSSIVRIENPIAKTVLQRISVNEQFQADKFIHDLEKRLELRSGREVNLLDFSDEDIEELEEELLMSWFSPRTYVENLCEVGSLILGVSFPDNLRVIIQEARSSYAFENFHAVHALCRTIIETCIREMYLKRNPTNRSRAGVRNIDLYRVKQMIHETSVGTLRNQIDNLYDKLSNVIHGHKTINKKEARESFRDTLKLVHELYAANRL